MKNFLGIVIVSLLLHTKTYAEIVKIDCTLNFDNGQVVTNYFELNSETNIYYNVFEGDQIFWTSVTETSGNQWMPIYHHVNRRSGVYTAGFGVTTSIFPEKGDPMVELIAERMGTCIAATSERKF
tara:strand:+ start:756 stop:1130 length:375 start_codon:yes stop_codon:yes gene_type:complete